MTIQIGTFKRAIASTMNELCVSTNAFIVKINLACSPSAYHRYQIYVLDPYGELKVLRLSGKYKMKYQNKARRWDIPNNHFALKGNDKDNIEKLSVELKKYNKTLTINYLNGY